MKNNLILNIILQFRALLLMLLLSITFGCAAGLKNDLQYHQSAKINPAYVSEIDRINFTVDPIFDEERAKVVFGYSPKGLGILPIHISIRNNSNGSLLIQKHHFQLSVDTGNTSETTKDSKKYQTETKGNIGNLDVTSGDRVLSVIGRIIFGGMGGPPDYRAEINHNFTREELRDTTLQPGQIMSGCVYFKIPKSQELDSCHLKISVIELQTQQRHQIEFDIANDSRVK